MRKENSRKFLIISLLSPCYPLTIPLLPPCYRHTWTIVNSALCLTRVNLKSFNTFLFFTVKSYNKIQHNTKQQDVYEITKYEAKKT